jgi:hypothetical protein
VTAEEKLQARAMDIAVAAAQEDIDACGDPDVVYIVIAARQIDSENFSLGTGLGHTTAVAVPPGGVKLILKTALDAHGNEPPA